MHRRGEYGWSGFRQFTPRRHDHTQLKLSFKEKADILPAVLKYKYDVRDLHKELVRRKADGWFTGTVKYYNTKLKKYKVNYHADTLDLLSPDDLHVVYHPFQKSCGNDGQQNTSESYEKAIIKQEENKCPTPTPEMLSLYEMTTKSGTIGS
ncbi:hypothetical protein ACROYT_G015245 [Oculina patagonica]